MKLISSIVAVYLFSFAVLAEEDHDHDHGHDDHAEHSEKDDHDEPSKEHDHHDDHGGHEDHAEDDGHAHEDEHGHHGEESFGQNKAIVEVMKEGSKFQLHTEALQFLAIQSAPVERLDESEYGVPLSAIVRFQNETGVYRVVGDTFEMLPVQILKEEKNRARIKSKALRSGDRIAISKLGNLRAAQLQASGQGGQGHAH